MRRALIHFGLSAAVVLAPALCCCQAGLFRYTATGAPAHPIHCVSQPAPVESCCLASIPSCCHPQRQSPDPNATPTRPDQPAAPPACACCGERPDAAQTESKPTVAAPEPTGEMVPFARAAHAAGSPEHLGQYRGLPPPGETGVDAKYAALYERHVMRC